MNLQEAIKIHLETKSLIRRDGWARAECWIKANEEGVILFSDGSNCNLDVEDVLAEDWRIQEDLCA